MRILQIFLVVCLSVFSCCATAFSQSGARLEKIVVLSRHGLRAPTQDAKLLAMWSEKAWPVWPVQRGDLTPRGAKLVKAMWSDIGQSIKKRGVLPEKQCPSQSEIYVRADVDERTRATAAALLSGVAPECSLGYAVAETAIDPLFHPVKAGLYRYDAVKTATDVMEMTHGGLDALQDEFAGALNLLGSITGAPAPNLCARFALMPNCQIMDLPNAVSVGSDGKSVRIVGSLGIASSLAEIFLLEYGEWPDALAGWGGVNGRVLSQLLPIHSKIFDIVNRAPIVAWANGSSLLSEMLAALAGTHTDKRVNDAKLVVFVGHDTNIANVAGLLEYAWQASGYPPNGIPPAGAIFLELWRHGGKLEVTARFYAQTPQTLHEAFSHNRPVSDFNPKNVPVYDRDREIALNIPLKDLQKFVGKKIADAPLAPQIMPPLVFGPPERTHKQ